MALLLENCNEIVENLYLGGINAALQTDLLLEHGVRGVVCCVREMELPSSAFHQDLDYYRVDVEDISREPIEWFWPEATEFIHGHMSKGQKVFVHCRAGVSRSASTVLAYLVACRDLPLYEAFVLARSKRPVVTPNMGFMQRLCEFEVERRGGQPSIVLDKYRSWYSGDQSRQPPDVGTGEPPTPTSPASPSARPEGVGRSPSNRLREAADKVKLMARINVAFHGTEHKDEISKDMVADRSLSEFVQARMEKIQRMLMRQAARDPTLGYCQGMHLAASLFASHADSEGEAFARFQVFVMSLRGLWMPGFPSLSRGVRAFEAAAQECSWFKHMSGKGLEARQYLPQVWLPMFTTVAPLETLAECLELLEANGLAGIVALALAIFDNLGSHLLRSSTLESVFSIIHGFADGDVDAPDLAQDMRGWLSTTHSSVELASDEDLDLPVTREGSRVVASEGAEGGLRWTQVWDVLQQADDAMAAAESASAAAEAAGAAIRANAQRRASILHSEQQKEVEGQRRATMQGLQQGDVDRLRALAAAAADVAAASKRRSCIGKCCTEE